MHMSLCELSKTSHGGVSLPLANLTSRIFVTGTQARNQNSGIFKDAAVLQRTANYVGYDC